MDFFEELNEKYQYYRSGENPYSPGGPYPQNYKQFLDFLDECTLCKLHESRTKLVPGEGPVPCNVMLIGEAPGQQEDRTGLPFVGRAGQLLNKILGSIDLSREKNVYITNTVKSRPPGNRNPQEDEILACRRYLVAQFFLIQPKVLLLAGSPALKSLLGKKMTITRSRGKWFYRDVPYMEEKLAIMPIFHPSYLLRYPSREQNSPKWLTWQDMKNLREVLQERNL